MRSRRTLIRRMAQVLEAAEERTIHIEREDTPNGLLLRIRQGAGELEQPQNTFLRTPGPDMRDII